MTRAKITHVAIRYKDEIYSLPPPNRHHNVIWMIVAKTGEPCDVHEEDQGFLDADGNYLNRKQALDSAKVNGQIKDPSKIRCEMLFSEDVW